MMKGNWAMHSSEERNAPRRKALHVAIASALATAAILATPTVDARIVSVQMSAPTIAFGGYSWPGRRDST